MEAEKPGIKRATLCWARRPRPAHSPRKSKLISKGNQFKGRRALSTVGRRAPALYARSEAAGLVSFKPAGGAASPLPEVRGRRYSRSGAATKVTLPRAIDTLVCPISITSASHSIEFCRISYFLIVCISRSPHTPLLLDCFIHLLCIIPSSYIHRNPMDIVWLYPVRFRAENQTELKVNCLAQNFRTRPSTAVGYHLEINFDK